MNLDVRRHLRVACREQRIPSRDEKSCGNRGAGHRAAKETARGLLRRARGGLPLPSALWRRDLRVVENRVVAAVVQHQHDGDFFLVFANYAPVYGICIVALNPVRQDKQPVDERSRLVGLEPHPVLPADGKARERRAFLAKLRDDRFGRRRRLAVHLFREYAEYLRATCRPVGRAGELAAVGECQRVLERVRRHFCLVVVGIPRQCRARGKHGNRRENDLASFHSRCFIFSR